MKTHINSLVAWLLLIAVTLIPCTALADPAKAEDDAYSMAVYYTQRGFAMAPTNHNGVGGTGTVIRFIIPVTRGLDYAFLVGVDQAMRDVDLYVYDEVGNLILDDRRPNRRAGVRFRSSYSGTVQVYLHIASASGLASYSVLVGRRTSAFAESADDNPNRAVEEFETPKME
ncbi:MAG: hypothetical protein ACFCU3_04990 [Verrucomicrobiales bacterium]